MQDTDTFVHITSINSDGTELRGWQIPIGIWTEIEYAVSHSYHREAYDRTADIETWALNTMYHVGSKPRSQYKDRMWGYHQTDTGDFIYGYLDDREYPNGYAEFQRYQKLRRELLSPEEIKAENDEKQPAERARLDAEMPVGGILHVIAAEGTGHMGSYKTTTAFARGYFESLSAARTKARSLDEGHRPHLRQPGEHRPRQPGFLRPRAHGCGVR